MKIIGATVGTSLPKPNFDQTDPKKGDYILGDRSFLRVDETLTESGISADAKATGDAINEVAAQKSRVQIATSDETEHLPTLTIHRLTKEEYDQLVENGGIDENAIYLTPDDGDADIDLSGYATIEALEDKANVKHEHTVSEITDFGTVVNEFEAALIGKAALDHSHDDKYYTEAEIDAKLETKVDISSLDNYYTQAEIDSLELITVEDIDNICGATIAIKMAGGNEVKF
jgi:hypothetical protein